MQQYLGLSRYHLWVVILYGIITPFLIFFNPDLNFSYNPSRIGIITLLILGAVIGFITARKGLRSLIYSFLFAFPEEIIFRGIVLGALLSQFGNALTAILLSSLIYGLAHLPNGASGWHPKNWNWKLSALALLAGIPLGAIFVLSGSLLFPTILHILLLVFLKLFGEKK